MKYGTLYGKNIEEMTKDELCEHLANSLNEINRLSGISWENKLKENKCILIADENVGKRLIKLGAVSLGNQKYDCTEIIQITGI